MKFYHVGHVTHGPEIKSLMLYTELAGPLLLCGENNKCNGNEVKAYKLVKGLYTEIFMNGIFMNGIQQCKAVALTRNVNKHIKTNTVQSSSNTLCSTSWKCQYRKLK